jgi:hypothetical protein
MDWTSHTVIYFQKKLVNAVSKSEVAVCEDSTCSLTCILLNLEKSNTEYRAFVFGMGGLIGSLVMGLLVDSLIWLLMGITVIGSLAGFCTKLIKQVSFSIAAITEPIVTPSMLLITILEVMFRALVIWRE